METNTAKGMDTWLRTGADEKVKSIIELAAPYPHEKVLEVGCGTGAILEGLVENRFGAQYFAVEPSKELYATLLHNLREVDLKAENTTLDRSSFMNEKFDIGIFSHVIEHVLNPAELILLMRKICRVLIIEIPLDGSLASNVRSRLKSVATRTARENNSAGHVNFFSSTDLDDLVHWCGGKVLDRRVYIPKPQLKYIAQHGSARSKLLSNISLLGSNLVGERLWARLYHGHYAIAVGDRELISESDSTKWTPQYFSPNQE